MNTVAISVILKQANFSLPHNLQNSNSIKHYMMVHYCYQFWIIHLHFSFYWKIKCAKDKVEEKESAWEGGLCKLRFCFKITRSRLLHPSTLPRSSNCPELAWAQSWTHRSFHIWEKALHMIERQCILAANVLNKHGGEVERRGREKVSGRNTEKYSKTLRWKTVTGGKN